MVDTIPRRLAARARVAAFAAAVGVAAVALGGVAVGSLMAQGKTSRPAGPSAKEPAKAAAASESVTASGTLPGLSMAATEALVARYEGSKHWLQKVVSLLSLGDYWHPAGNRMIVQAMRQRDVRLRAFGLEVLLSSDPELLPMVATPELLAELVDKQLTKKNAYYLERVRLALRRLLPSAEATSRREWATWWSHHKAEHQPAAWRPRPAPKGDAEPAPQQGGTSASAAAVGVLQRYQHGLDIVICIDTTSGMQPMMASLSDALAELVDIAPGISPKLRFGVVQYKDYGELGKPGVRVVQSLSRRFRTVYDKVAKLTAYGGSDMPEAVLGGVQLALGKSMKWSPDANKFLVVIGDAPPHPNERAKLLELVRTAREQPVHLDAHKKPARDGLVKPVRTCAVGVVVKVGPKVTLPAGYKEFVKSQEAMQKDFREVARVGDGVYLELAWEIHSDIPLSAAERKAQKPAAKPGVRATRRIVETILRLSFGERRRREITEYLRIYYAHKDGGLIK